MRLTFPLTALVLLAALWVAEHQPDVLLLRHDMAIRQAALASNAWKQVFENDRYSILVPVSSDLSPVPVSKIAYLDPDGRPIRPYMP